MVLQVKRWQGGAGEPGRQFTGPAGLTEVPSDPVEEQGVGVAGSGCSVEVNDASAEKHSAHICSSPAEHSRSLVFPTRMMSSFPHNTFCFYKGLVDARVNTRTGQRGKLHFLQAAGLSPTLVDSYWKERQNHCEGT